MSQGDVISHSALAALISEWEPLIPFHLPRPKGAVEGPKGWWVLTKGLGPADGVGRADGGRQIGQ